MQAGPVWGAPREDKRLRCSPGSLAAGQRDNSTEFLFYVNVDLEIGLESWPERISVGSLLLLVAWVRGIAIGTLQRLPSCWPSLLHLPLRNLVPNDPGREGTQWDTPSYEVPVYEVPVMDQRIRFQIHMTRWSGLYIPRWGGLDTKNWITQIRDMDKINRGACRSGHVEIKNRRAQDVPCGENKIRATRFRDCRCYEAGSCFFSRAVMMPFKIFNPFRVSMRCWQNRRVETSSIHSLPFEIKTR